MSKLMELIAVYVVIGYRRKDQKLLTLYWFFLIRQKLLIQNVKPVVFDTFGSDSQNI